MSISKQISGYMDVIIITKTRSEEIKPKLQAIVHLIVFG